MDKLDDMVIANIRDTKMQYRNEYCEKNGIPETDRGRTRKAARYIREHSAPLFVLFENFSDVLKMKLEPEQTAEFSALFEQIRGYNVYFFGGFYPGDENYSVNPLLKSFLKEDFILLFGGRFNLAWMAKLPNMYREMEKVNPNYNRFIMRYNGECHQMIMPCGELIAAADDPDEEDIV